MVPLVPEFVIPDPVQGVVLGLQGLRLWIRVEFPVHMWGRGWVRGGEGYLSRGPWPHWTGCRGWSCCTTRNSPRGWAPLPCTSRTSYPTGSGAAPWVFRPWSHSPRPDRAPGPPIRTTHCHTPCSRPHGNAPPLAPRRSHCPRSGARTGALQGWEGAGRRVRSGSFGPKSSLAQMRKGKHPTPNWSPDLVSSPYGIHISLSAPSALAAEPYVLATPSVVMDQQHQQHPESC